MDVVLEGTLRHWALGAVTLSALILALYLPPIPQDPAYHEFADKRTIGGIPNFWNVASNFPFLLVGVFGLMRFSGLRNSPFLPAYLVVCFGVVFIGLGSAYYHYEPRTVTLTWDRLPMTIAFMALFSMVVTDRISEKLGRGLLWPLVLTGVASVLYWHWSELQGRGDLRPYAIVQFLPMLLIALILIWYREGVLSKGWLWSALATYALAKAAEHYDHAIYAQIGFSGHGIKHLLASLAILWTILAVPGAHEDFPNGC